MRAFVALWDELARDRYGVADPKLRQFRYGVQVNSLGLTANQPENNAWRILIEALGVTLSRDARCRALQLPAWNEALSLPGPWDQQWSLRLQQILAHETDLLEYDDLFTGSPVIAAKVSALCSDAGAELARIGELGGIEQAIETGYCKRALVRAMADRVGRIERGEQVVVGVNRWTEGLPSPLDSGVPATPVAPEHADAIAAVERTRATRDPARAREAVAALVAAARDGRPLMELSIEAALARVTTGEWAGALRGVFGDYRAATGLEGGVPVSRADTGTEAWDRVRTRVAALPRRPKLLVAKPGLDGHSNGAEAVALAARDAGFEVIYGGIRLAPAAIAQTAISEAVDIIGLSILSGSHLALIGELVGELVARGARSGDPAIVVGGTIPDRDHDAIAALGVARIFGPQDYRLIDIVEALVDLLPSS